MALIAFQTLQQSYEDNADYLEDNSLTKAKAFITASTQLIARLPAESTNDDVTVKMQVELISEQRREVIKRLRAKDPRRNNLTVFLVVILSAAKDLPCNYREILRCAQNDSRAK